MGKKINLLGQQFGRWTVIAEAPSKHTSYGRTLAMWTCQCKCGTIKDIAANDLKAGKSTQCKSCQALSHCQGRIYPRKDFLLYPEQPICYQSFRQELLECCFRCFHFRFAKLRKS